MELPQIRTATAEDARFKNNRLNKMRPTLVNDDEEDDKGDYQKSYVQFIDGAVSVECADHMIENRNDIYNVTGVSLILDCWKFVKDMNNSQETIQQNKLLAVDKKNLVKKPLEMFAENAEEKDEYKKCYKQFVEYTKLEARKDSDDGTSTAELVKFNTSKPEDRQIKSKEYVDRKMEGQSHNYVITGEIKNQEEARFTSCSDVSFVEFKNSDTPFSK